MKTDVIDKILIGLLLLMLPVGIVITYRIYSHQQQDQEAAVEKAKLEKIDQAIAQMEASSQKKAELVIKPQIVINGVDYASPSGELIIKGKAPEKNLNVFVSTVVTKHPKPTPTPKNSAKKTATASAQASSSGQLAVKPGSTQNLVLGEAVEVKAVPTDDSGSFTFTYKTNPKDLVAVLDIKFDQGESTTTIQYNIDMKKRTL